MMKEYFKHSRKLSLRGNRNQGKWKLGELAFGKIRKNNLRGCDRLGEMAIRECGNSGK